MEPTIMKKYIKPEIENIVMITAKPVLLEVSGEYTGGQVLAPALDGDLIYE